MITRYYPQESVSDNTILSTDLVGDNTIVMKVIHREFSPVGDNTIGAALFQGILRLLLVCAFFEYFVESIRQANIVTSVKNDLIGFER